MSLYASYRPIPTPITVPTMPSPLTAVAADLAIREKDWVYTRRLLSTFVMYLLFRDVGSEYFSSILLWKSLSPYLAMNSAGSTPWNVTSMKSCRIWNPEAIMAIPLRSVVSRCGRRPCRKLHQMSRNHE